MPHALTLPVVAGLALVGASVTGVALGRSAIAEINPAHFQDDGGSQFFADLAPNRRADWDRVQATEYQQAATAPPPAATPNATWPIATPPLHDPAVDRALAQAWREVRTPAAQVRYVERVTYEQPGYDAPREDPVPERVRRYASYPVYRDPPPPPLPERDDGPDEGDAATQ
jgi:hypothetical protein